MTGQEPDSSKITDTFLNKAQNLKKKIRRSLVANKPDLAELEADLKLWAEYVQQAAEENHGSALDLCNGRHNPAGDPVRYGRLEVVKLLAAYVPELLEELTEDNRQEKSRIHEGDSDFLAHVENAGIYPAIRQQINGIIDGVKNGQNDKGRRPPESGYGS